MAPPRKYECSKCGDPKDGSHDSYCKACFASYMKERREADPEEARAQERARYAKSAERYRARKKAWRVANPDKARRHHTLNNLRKSGLISLVDVDGYERRLAEQGEVCAICQGTEGPFHLDHDHATNSLREFLCRHCNLGLGNFRDNPDSLAAAIVYLEKHRQPELAAVGEKGR